MSVKILLGDAVSNKPPSPEPEPSKAHYPIKLIMQDDRTVWVSVPWLDRLSVTGVILPEHFTPSAQSQEELDVGVQDIGSYLATPDSSPWKIVKTARYGGLFRMIQLQMGVRSSSVRFDLFKKTGKWRLRIDLNPRKLGVEGAEAFCTLIDAFAHTDFSLARFLADAHATRLDVAVDIVGLGVSDLLASAKDQGKRVAYAGEEGNLETLYIARKTKKQKANGDTKTLPAPKKPRPLQMLAVLYDRRRERISAGKLPPFGPAPVTRVEVGKRRFGSKKVHLSDLQALANPLAVLRVGHVEGGGFGGTNWAAYAAVRRTATAAEAAVLLGLGEPLARAFEQALHNHPTDVLRHEEVWAHWHKALALSGVKKLTDHIATLAAAKSVGGTSEI